ncbi:MarR family transcriptional regulator [Paraburkholderia sacchari]|uniref:hypothetical protein n=1 Tax=Paraburkholderia sacchari TaxID=159450 RepID=UPI0039A45FF2
MRVRVLLSADSSARLVLKELESTAALTQFELARRTGRALSSVCKALTLLLAEDYVRSAGATAHRMGATTGRAPVLFARTGKRLVLEDFEPHYEALTARELAAIVDAMVRQSIDEVHIGTH